MRFKKLVVLIVVSEVLKCSISSEVSLRHSSGYSRSYSIDLRKV